MRGCPQVPYYTAAMTYTRRRSSRRSAFRPLWGCLDPETGVPGDLGFRNRHRLRALRRHKSLHRKPNFFGSRSRNRNHQAGIAKNRFTEAFRAPVFAPKFHRNPVPSYELRPLPETRFPRSVFHGLEGTQAPGDQAPAAPWGSQARSTGGLGTGLSGTRVPVPRGLGGLGSPPDDGAKGGRRAARLRKRGGGSARRAQPRKKGTKHPWLRVLGPFGP